MLLSLSSKNFKKETPMLSEIRKKMITKIEKSTRRKRCFSEKMVDGSLEQMLTEE